MSEFFSDLRFDKLHINSVVIWSSIYHHMFTFLFNFNMFLLFSLMMSNQYLMAHWDYTQPFKAIQRKFPENCFIFSVCGVFSILPQAVIMCLKIKIKPKFFPQVSLTVLFKFIARMDTGFFYHIIGMLNCLTCPGYTREFKILDEIFTAYNKQ